GKLRSPIMVPGYRTECWKIWKTRIQQRIRKRKKASKRRPRSQTKTRMAICQFWRLLDLAFLGWLRGNQRYDLYYGGLAILTCNERVLQFYPFLETLSQSDGSTGKGRKPSPNDPDLPLPRP